MSTRFTKQDCKSPHKQRVLKNGSLYEASNIENLSSLHVQKTHTHNESSNMSL